MVVELAGAAVTTVAVEAVLADVGFTHETGVGLEEFWHGEAAFIH